jgi:tetratricopeptide (TPR) repeat protein
LGRLLRSTLIATLLLFSFSTLLPAQQAPAMSLQDNEALFDVLAAVNACGFDQDLGGSVPLRLQLRKEIEHAATSMQAQGATENICRFYEEHKLPEAGRTLSQYVSLALFLSDGPVFELKVKEADLPPDAFRVLGFVPLLQNFYITTELHKIWMSHREEYTALLDRSQGPVTNTLTATDYYLRRAMSGYLRNSFTLYMEPLVPPSQTNSRNYAEDYFIVFSPGTQELPLRQIRHAYLHYLLEPLMLHRNSTIIKLLPLQESVKQAPLSENYRKDVGLLLTESLIRAVEARLERGPQIDETARLKMVSSSMEAGFILTRYFYDALIKFEKEDEGLDVAYPEWLYNIDLRKIQKEVALIHFAPAAAAEVVSASPHRVSMTGLAERALISGNPETAARFANEALKRQEEPSRVHFVLARAAILQGDLEGARTFFTQTLGEAKEPRLVAWSHIYLGRICDMTGDREAAVKHYQQALGAGDETPQTKAAAQKGLNAPFAPPAHKNNQ